MARKSCFTEYARGDALLERYHDEEWGLPCRDEQKLVEMFLLETFQAGLSWKTILHKREGFRRAFDDFDDRRIAAYGTEKIEALMADPDIIRNRRKIEGAVANARCIGELREEYGSFSGYLWHFTEGQTIYEDASVTRDELSDAVSRDMKKRGMKFVGSVTIFSFLQSVGIIYSHPENCRRFAADGAERYLHNKYTDGKVRRE
ncbi:MAG: DNA-3-methyladenine glycosylase I [Anaerovoracaceae bacterium]|jgi:DNA-3-methyladenine glycosylase I